MFFHVNKYAGPCCLTENVRWPRRMLPGELWSVCPRDRWTDRRTDARPLYNASAMDAANVMKDMTMVKKVGFLTWRHTTHARCRKVATCGWRCWRREKLPFSRCGTPPPESRFASRHCPRAWGSYRCYGLRPGRNEAESRANVDADTYSANSPVYKSAPACGRLSWILSSSFVDINLQSISRLRLHWLGVSSRIFYAISVKHYTVL